MKNLRKLITFVFMLLVGAYVVAFTLSNRHEVALDPVLWTQMSGSLAMWMMWSFCLGALLAGLFASVFLLKGSHQKRKAVKALKKTNKELEKVRTETQSQLSS